MGTLPAAPATQAKASPRKFLKSVFSKLTIAAGLLAAFASPEHISEIFLESLSAAYTDVTVFVAATMIPIHFLGHKLNLGKFEPILENKYCRIPLAALLGASPGCGGAIVVTAAFARGKLCFASVVAVLTATIGDAAFLLLSKSPTTAITMMTIGVAVGTLSGWIASLIHDDDYLRPPPPTDASAKQTPTNLPKAKLPPERVLMMGIWWMFFLSAAFIRFSPVAMLEPMGIDPDAALLPLGAIGAIICILNWFLTPANDDCCTHPGSVQAAVNTTNRVTIWVIVAFAAYELIALNAPVPLEQTFAVTGPLMPIIGTLIGFFPSCGPQIVYTELFLRGVVDLPGLVANGISNDGDAIFPMLAIAPKAAMLSFFYTALPAILTGYAVYWFVS